MSTDGVVFLAARTARSQAYAQAMAAAGFDPAAVILYGPDKGTMQGQTDTRSGGGRHGDLLLPELGESVEATCARRNWPRSILAEADVNHPIIAETVAALSPRLVVVSLYGGQIVKPPLLDVAPLLHMHAGWLPDYRGSTTVYYSWLNGEGTAVTAFLLAAGIDTGPVMMRRRYPAPPAGVDVDYVWDGAIRADTLVAVLRVLAETGRLPDPIPQDHGEGCTYYTIHPLLKHLALLQRERDTP